MIAHPLVFFFVGEAIDQLGNRLKQDLQNEILPNEAACKSFI